MSTRGSSLQNNTAVAQIRLIDSRYDVIKEVSEHLLEIEQLAAEDIGALIDSLNEAKDFTGITVVAGTVASFDPETKTITVPTLKGDTGATGAVGPIGPQGPIGLTGARGAQGAKGDTGAMGIQGPQGPTGPAGVAGVAGIDGADLTVEQISYNGNGTFTWQFSDDTSYTTPDLRGPQGVTGAKGDKGDQGVSVHHIKGTSTTNPLGDFGVSPFKDTYTLYGDASETLNLGHFVVANGLDTGMQVIQYDGDMDGIVEEADKISNFNKHGVVSGMDISAVGNIITITDGKYELNGVEYEFFQTEYDTTTFLAGTYGTIGINVGGLVVKVEDFFTPLELLSVIEIGAFAKLTDTTVDIIAKSQFQLQNSLRNMMVRHKAFEGTYFNGTACLITESATPSQLNLTGGYINTPNAETKLISPITNINGAIISHTSGEYKISGQSPIIVTEQYDDGTNLVALGTNKFATHTVARSSRTGTIYLIYGLTQYNNIGDAQNAPYNLGVFASNEATSEVEPLTNIVVRQGQGIVSLLDIRNKTFNTISTVLTALSLQSAYDLSSIPQIVLADGNPLEVRNDAGDANAVLQRWTDSVGNVIVAVTKDGLVVNGTTTTVNSTDMEIVDAIITLNKGETGAGVTSGAAGILIERGSETNYIIKFDETDNSFKIGELGSEQKVATREDAPISGGIAVWNDTTFRFDTMDNTASNIQYDNSISGLTAIDVGEAINEVDGRLDIAETKLATIEEGAEVNVVTSVNTYTGDITLTKADVGLDNVDNTSDANKPLSNAVTNLVNSVNLTRADKYLASQNIANMLYTDGNLSKIRYNNDTDVNYEVLNYVSGNLSSINHYTGGVLRGTTTLSYTNGNLVSAVFA